jgi:hypothetical protein
MKINIKNKTVNNDLINIKINYEGGKSKIVSRTWM